MVETDIYLTTDNVVVIMHDETLDRTTNGTGNVVNMTSNQVMRYVVDYYKGTPAQPIPTLEQMLQDIKDKPHQKLVIEMKHPADKRLADAMTALIQKYDIMDQVVVISFIQMHLQNTSSNMPGTPVGYLMWLDMDEGNPMYATYEALERVQPYTSVCNPGYSGWGTAVIRDLAYRGVTLWPWTLNKQAEFDRLMIDGVGGITTDYSQWSSDYIESIHWNSASRVISSTYRSILTDITNSCEVVVIEDTLGISCSAGNITVPERDKGGKASFYYRYKSTNPSGTSYYTVTEIRTIEIAPAQTFELNSGSQLTLENGMLTEVTEYQTVAEVKAQFKHPVGILDRSGNELDDNAMVTTGATVYLKVDSAQKAVIVMKGDVNGDGRVNKADCTVLRNYFLKKEDLTGVYLLAADCDGDGSVTTTDYVRIRAHALYTYNLFTET
jgi:glycerophosphoryl diester phosphodiesterase